MSMITLDFTMFFKNNFHTEDLLCRKQYLSLSVCVFCMCAGSVGSVPNNQNGQRFPHARPFTGVQQLCVRYLSSTVPHCDTIRKVHSCQSSKDLILTVVLVGLTETVYRSGLTIPLKLRAVVSVRRQNASRCIQSKVFIPTTYVY